MIRVRIDFWDRRYTAVTDLSGGMRQPVSEWPPAPYRLIAALLAGAHTLPEQSCQDVREVIRAVTTAPPPVIWTPDSEPWTQTPPHWKPSSLSPPAGGGKSTIAATIQVTNGVPERTNAGQYWWADRVLAGPVPAVFFEIDIDLDGGSLELLRDAARAVPYFGRSTHPAVLSVSAPASADHPAPGPGFSRWTPAKYGGNPVSSWGPRLVDWLDERHEAARHGEGSVPPPPRESAFPGCEVKVHYREERRVHTQVIVTSKILGGLSPSEAHATLIRVGDTGEATVFPLVDVGHPHATGRVLGFGVACPDREEAQRVSDVVSDLAVTQRRVGPKRPWFMEPYRWARSSRVWASATPLVGHATVVAAELSVEHEIASRLGLAAEVALWRQPFMTGQRLWPDTCDGNDQWFASITFPETVDGPLLLGSRISEGYGLMVPAEGGAAEEADAFEASRAG